jgi:hypothetical protein
LATLIVPGDWCCAMLIRGPQHTGPTYKPSCVISDAQRSEDEPGGSKREVAQSHLSSKRSRLTEEAGQTVVGIIVSHSGEVPNGSFNKYLVLSSCSQTLEA